jgi:predicted glutamine amidotransferase
MCELMALSFAQPISADFSIHEFALRGEENASGWGLAWYPDQSLAIVKEPIAWHESKFTRFLETYAGLVAPTYIAHVRHQTTGGSPTHADTHPFAREWAGRDYAFCHNGTIEEYARRYAIDRFRPIGATDSEHVFCHLLDQISRTGQPLETDESWRWLHGKLRSINESGTLNCLMSDGRRLFCYHDAAKYKGLCFRNITLYAEGPRHFEDQTVEIEVESATPNHGFVIATRALSPSGWTPFDGGELIVLEDGAIRFSSKAGRVVRQTSGERS